MTDETENKPLARTTNGLRDVLFDEITELRNGGGDPCLCHGCQREIYWRGGFLEVLIRDIRFAARFEQNKYGITK